MTNGISIIICCYNSEKRLPETLKHIAHQQVDEVLSWEVLIINNNSNDNTKTVARLEWDKYHLSKVRFRVVDEPRPGLSNARERGINESQYDYILFCDDDNWLSTNYLITGLNIMNSRPEVGIIGGKGVEAPEITPPKWFKENRLTYAIGPHSVSSGDITETRGDVYGAGAFFRKEALNRLYKNGFRSLLSDRTGTKLSSGGDSELCICVRLLGYRIWYDERLTFQHFIPKERLSETYFIRLHKGISQGLTQLLPYYFITDHSIQYEKRSWLRKHWTWFLACRFAHILSRGMAWNIYSIKKYRIINHSNLNALFFYESMKTLWREKNKIATNHSMIINSDWYRMHQTTKHGI